ncbi:hypothetical protein ANN_14213 [Periplaneta americana]|uniref:PiggyBac transposable element-derived protein domain-containing protein n=1 Tax=Periplaneta americana TaxID=6978 RepID=A0ABQ8SWR9_PERAM|nr:hypothetical protein ANN_14213 [Periplaneta americana]
MLFRSLKVKIFQEKVVSRRKNKDGLYIILIHTNQRLEILRQSCADAFIRNSKDFVQEEILGIIGLLLNCGVNRQNKGSVRELYSEENFPLYRATLSEHRFRLLLKCLRFDNSVTHEDLKKRDQFAPIRDIWNMMMRKFPMFYNPNEFVTVDEELITFHGRCPFRLYIPTKPGKYGIEVNLFVIPTQTTASQYTLMQDSLNLSKEIITVVLK